MSGDTEQDLLDEIGELTRLVAAQERALAEAAEEIRRTHATLGYRSHRRFDRIAERLLRNPVLRQPYRIARRTFEIWVEHGFFDIFRFAARKVGNATRGRSLLVEDHSPPDPNAYRVWMQRHTPRPEAYAAMRAAAAAFRDPPRVDVLMAAARPDVAALGRTIQSVKAQVYDRWELFLAVPAAAFESLKPALQDVTDDRRIHVQWGPSPPTLADVVGTGGGSVVAFVGAGDTLAPEALFEVAKRFDDDPAAEIVYSDQDVLDTTGQRIDPLFKPEWDPELLLSINILGPFTGVRRSLIDRVGGLRPERGAGQAYDLLLRASEQTTNIARVARVLCHVGPRETTRDAIAGRHAASRDERRALEDALQRRRRPGCVDVRFTSRGQQCYTTRFRLDREPMVSVIIPTRDQAGLLRTTIESIRARTSYGAYEIVVVDNDSRDPEALAYLASLEPPCSVHRWPQAFNYSALNNFGVRAARGEHLLFLNNDVEVINADWLTALVEYSQFDTVGAVGAKLLYSDSTIQHAGVVFNHGGLGQHAFRCMPKEVPGIVRLADLPRSCSAVTGACMMVRRSVFEELGGFDENLKVVLNDIDLCLRIRERGYGVVYTPYAQLYHYEGASRGRLHPPPDEERFLARWSALISQLDPYYNPNLSHKRDDWSPNLDEDL